MATRIAADQVFNLQQIETMTMADGANSRMITITGQFTVGINAIETSGNSVAAQRATFSLLVGPELGTRDFLHSIASAWFTNMSVATGDGGSVNWTITEVDADHDDESKRVELRVEVHVEATKANVSVRGIGFQVTILVFVPV